MAGGDRRDQSQLNRGGTGLTSREGLTNGGSGEVSIAMAVDVGLINGLSNEGPKPRGRAHPLLGSRRKKRRAVREALERKANAPLPGADDE